MTNRDLVMERRRWRLLADAAMLAGEEAWHVSEALRQAEMNDDGGWVCPAGTNEHLRSARRLTASLVALGADLT